MGTVKHKKKFDFKVSRLKVRLSRKQTMKLRDFFYCFIFNFAFVTLRFVLRKLLLLDQHLGGMRENR